MFKSKGAYIGLGVVVVIAIVAILAPWIAPFDPFAIILGEKLSLPSALHWLGQDANGADILSRLLFGARISLIVAGVVVVISTIVGTFLGLVSGYWGGWIDTLIMRLVDILLAFPGLLLAIALVAVLGPDLKNVMIALSVLGWVPYARLVRGQVLSLRHREFVMAARCTAQSQWRIMGRHIIPNVLSPIIVQATFHVAGVIIAESSLSFLGLGVPPGTPSWGMMLSEGKSVIMQAPHVSFFPGVAIMVMVLAFNFLGDGLRDRFDPKVVRS